MPDLITSADLVRYADMHALRVVLASITPGTRLHNRPDIILRPIEDNDSTVLAWKAIPARSSLGLVEWHTLLGLGRSRLSLSDGRWTNWGGL